MARLTEERPEHQIKHKRRSGHRCVNGLGVFQAEGSQGFRTGLVATVLMGEASLPIPGAGVVWDMCSLESPSLTPSQQEQGFIDGIDIHSAA